MYIYMYIYIYIYHMTVDLTLDPNDLSSYNGFGSRLYTLI